MEDRIKGLRIAMNKHTFNQLEFTEQLQKNINEKINKQETKEEEVVFAIMNLLSQEKSGYELANSIRSRGIRNFEDNDGFLYSMLHRLENVGYLQSRWDETEIKYYLLTEKGRKILRKLEKKQARIRFVLNELYEG